MASNTACLLMYCYIALLAHLAYVCMCVCVCVFMIMSVGPSSL